MNRILLIFLVSFCLLSTSSRGQQIKYFEPFDSLSSDSYFYPVGKINKNYLVLKVFATELPTLFIFNDSGSLVTERIISIPEITTTVIPRILVSQNSWTIVFQHEEKNTIYLATARFNESGELLQPYTRLDSSRVNKLGVASYYNYSVSADKKKIISYRMILGLQTDKILIDFFAITSEGKEIEKGSHYVPFRKELQEITPIFQHTDGETYFAIYDKPSESRLSAKTTIYQLSNKAKDLFVKEIVFKISKPVRPVFASNAISGELIFASLYRDHYSAGIKGLLITKIDLERISAEASKNIIPFTKTKNGEWNIGRGNVKLGYKERRGDVLSISNCAMLGRSGELTILFENSYSFTPRTTKDNFQQLGNSNFTYSGRSNITPSQDFDLLRDHIGGVGTPPNQQLAGNGYIFVRNGGIAPVSSRDIWGSAILSENYTYYAKDIVTNPGTVANSASQNIQRENIQLQLDSYNKPLRKGKLTVNYPSSLPFVSGSIASQRELTILSFIPNSDNSFTLEFYDAENQPYRALLSSKNEYKLFYSEVFGFGGEKEILTLFSTADDKKIGLAIVSW